MRVVSERSTRKAGQTGQAICQSFDETQQGCGSTRIGIDRERKWTCFSLILLNLLVESIHISVVPFIKKLPTG